MSRFMLCILLILCAVGAPDVSLSVELMATPQAKYSLQPAKTYYAAGETEAALSNLRRYIIDTPDSPKLAEAYTLIGRILLEQQRNSDALFYLQRIDVDQRTPESSLLMVAALQREQQMELAGEHLAVFTADQFSGEEQTRYYQLKSEDLLFRNQPLQALVVLRAALQQAGYSDQTQLFTQSQLILKQLDDAELAEVGFMFAETELNDAFSLFRAHQAIDAGDEALARQIAEPLVSCAQILAAKIGAVKVLDQVHGQPWQQRAVGVVLPLSGRYAPFGELVQQGIELAISESMTQSVRFIYLDSQADGKLAAQAVNELVNGDRVMAVIGPLMGDATQQSIAIAEAAKVPLLTLSHRQGLPEQGEYIFRNSLTTQQQVDLLADYAIDELGLNTYSILAPDSRAGQEFSRQFAAAIESRGGDIEYRMTFAEQATDFRRQLVLMKGGNPDAPPVENEKVVAGSTDDETAADGELEEVEEQPDWLPTVDFEALFIPAYAESVAMIAPQLAYYGIENVQLIGINGWNAPSLFQQAGRYTRGAIFTDGFYAQSEEPQVANFVEQYKRRFSETPSILEAQAYDCAKIVMSQLAQLELTNSTMLQQSLLSLEHFSGVTGIQGFDEVGEAERKPVLLQMGRRHLERIEWVATPELVPAMEAVPEVEGVKNINSYHGYER